MTRKNLVLKQMYTYNHLTKSEYENSILEGVDCTDFNTKYDNSYYQQAINEACKLLNISEKELIRNGYQLLTYLDENLQQCLYEDYSANNFDCDKLSIICSNGGKVLAYLGVSPFDLSNMKRTPASILKPLAVYLPSIIHNICNINTPILDEKIDFEGYSPRNVNDTYSGWIDINDALMYSKNIPAVKLLNELGIDKSIEFLNSLGISIDENDNSLALALGALTKGISPLELLSCYSVFPNNGNRYACHFVDKILDKDNRVIYSASHNPTSVCNAESAFLVNKMLIDTAQNGTAKNLASLNYEVGSKTGTNYVDNKTLDLWNIAYTSENMILTWLGSADNKGINNMSSSFHATNINKKILEHLYCEHSPNNFVVPEGIVTQSIDLLELKNNHKLTLASSATPERYKKEALFKIDNLPIESQIFTKAPTPYFTVEMSNEGAKINYLTEEIYKYTLTKASDGYTSTLQTYTNQNGIVYYTDDKVFSYNFVQYKLKVTNKYTNTDYTFEINIEPKSYLQEHIIKNDFTYNTKKRWYV